MARFNYFLLTCVLLWNRSSWAAKPDLIIASDGQPVTWSADWPSDARVQFLSSKPLALVLSCNFRNFNVTVTRARVCFKNHDPLIRECSRFLEAPADSSFTVGGAEVKLSRRSETGLTAALRDVPVNVQLPLMYAECRGNAGRKGYVDSNRLFLLDMRRHFPQAVWKPSAAPQLRRNAASSVQCLQRSLGIKTLLQSGNEKFRQPAVRIDFDWFYCSDSSVGACEASKKRLRDLLPFSDWPVQVRADGQLYMPSVPAKVASQLKGKRLLCTLMGKPAAFYAAPVNIVDSTATSALAMVRPQSGSGEVVVLYNSVDFSLVLPCLFNSTPGASVDVTWSFEAAGKKKIPLKMGSENMLKLSPSGITFQGRFSPATEGLYHCSVTSSGRTVTGAYNVTYKGPLQFAGQSERSILAPLFGSLKLPCVFEDSARVIPSVTIMGQTLDFGNTKAFNESLRSINQDYAAEIPAVDAAVNLMRPRPGQKLFYTERTCFERPAAHYVTCLGYQTPFSHRARFEIRTELQIRASIPKVCSDSCVFSCDAAEPGRLTANVTWFLQKDADCASKEVSWIGSGTKLGYGVGKAAEIFVRCSVRVQAPCGAKRVFEVCEVARVSLQLGFFRRRGLLLVAIGATVFVILLVSLAIFVLYRRRRKGSSPSSQAT